MTKERGGPLRWIQAAIGAFILAAMVAAGTLSIGPLPPPARLLDPVHGVWAVARSAELPRTASGRIAGLGSPVDVRYDSRDVPHIFAATEDDAYRALGYVVARDRLFQIDLQVRAGAGTLTELVGPAAMPIDRDTRRLGLPDAARRAFARLDTGSATAHALRAYADGVNAWIAQLGPAEMPIEYQLLGGHPVPWAPVDAYHLLNRMSRILAYDDLDLSRARVARMVGDSAARALFPLHSPLQQPIVPTADPLPHFLVTHFPVPTRDGHTRDGHTRDGHTRDAHARDAHHDVLDSLAAFSVRPERSLVPLTGSAADRNLGSDNWAVAPRRSRTGSAMLAGDPHLDLTLPSIWYEAHLVVPARLDVAGVTIAGGPAVVIGFTRDVAWTFTNTGADVLDYYAETVDDSVHPRRYRLDGHWRALGRRLERYRDPSGGVIAVDTMLLTHRGPVRRVGGQWLSMRWTALEGGGALPALLAASNARTTRDWLQATAGYDVPAQNMLVADRTGSIAIRSTGAYPIRPGDGRGDEIRDGATSESDWRGFLGIGQYPTAADPPLGYLVSANQEPIDPSARAANQAVYFGANWEAPWRAMRINALLGADPAVTVDDMRRWQTDPGSPRADYFVPVFLAAIRHEARRGSISAEAQEAGRLLGQWDHRYTRANTRAVLFEAAMHELARRVWAALVPASSSVPRAVPSSSVLAALLRDSTSDWWSQWDASGPIPARVPRIGPQRGYGGRPAASQATTRVAIRDSLLAASLAAAYDTVQRRYGPPDAGGWQWSRIQHANIYHLLRVPAFSRLDLPIAGGPETLNPSSGAGTQGSSWRMVVQLASDVHAWAVYPGGQSGNPSSSRYADRLKLWLSGSLDPVRFPRAATDLAPSDVRSILELSPRS